MKIDYSQKTYRLSLSLMCAAMTLVCLYIATLLPGGRLALYFLAGMLTIPPVSYTHLCAPAAFHYERAGSCRMQY